MKPLQKDTEELGNKKNLHFEKDKKCGENKGLPLSRSLRKNDASLEFEISSDSEISSESEIS